ncbi:hypothetical protein Clacol_010325 [Clathrus columnatus]|uniref:Uncharacterized protein n=1 Tax=Clathrus columnatus TaxID=1419009 RepID=A0AAV5ATF0_9AGAM|nr:hypothetical protein Clacol_010325 [Clathrus columnatus]
MSLNGIYNITLDEGSPDANSASFIIGTETVSLVALNKADIQQKWYIRPVNGAGVENAYIIRSVSAAQYVVPNGNALASSNTPYIWIITGTTGTLISIVASLNWFPNDADEVK